MNFTVLAIGWLLLAAAEIAPKFIKDEDKAGSVAFVLGLISFIIFAVSLVSSINNQ
jgi:hypothetical protein